MYNMNHCYAAVIKSYQALLNQEEHKDMDVLSGMRARKWSEVQFMMQFTRTGPCNPHFKRKKEKGSLTPPPGYI